MNENINKAFEIIFNNASLTEKLFRQNTPEEFYKFCSSVHGGYTEEEFDEYIDSIMNDAMDEIEKEDFNLKLDEHDLKNISGGSGKNIYNKFLASTLASLALITPMTPASYAAGDTAGQRHGNIMRAAEVTQKKSFWEKYKRKIIGAGIFALTVGGMLWWKKPWQQNQIRNPIDNPVDNPAGGARATRATSAGRGRAAGRRGNRGANGNGQSPPSVVQETRDDLNARISNFVREHKTAGLAITIPVALGVLLETIGGVSKSFNQTTGAYYTIQRMKESLESWIKYKENLRNNKPVELQQSINNIDNLFAEIRGQEEAKRKVRSLVFGILHKKKNAELSGKKYSKGDVLYFYGPSRVGKSLMAEGLARHKILSTSTEPYYISASEIDKDSNKETVLDQLFGMNSYGGYGYGGYDDYGGYGGGGANAVKKPKNLVKYISENPNGVIIIDEYDKMWSPALDEVFRTIVDKGTANVKGQKIDCSGMTFILTSNECNASVQGGNQYSGEDIDDGTGSRTFIKHDKSFLNRIKPVEFKNLDAKSYEQIARTEMQTDLVDYWNNPEIAGLDVVISDAAYKGMAKSVEKRNEGASHVKTLIDLLQMEVTDIVLKGELKQKDYYRGKKLFVEFEPNGDRFIVRETPHGPVINTNSAAKLQESMASYVNKDVDKKNNEESKNANVGVKNLDEKSKDGDYKDFYDFDDFDDFGSTEEAKNDLKKKTVVQRNDGSKKSSKESKGFQPKPVQESSRLFDKSKNQKQRKQQKQKSVVKNSKVSNTPKKRTK